MISVRDRDVMLNWRGLNKVVTIPQSIQTMMAEPTPKPAKIKEKYSLSLADAAAFFHELAKDLEGSGVIEMGTPTQSISVMV